jgi:O-acetyl-ADP-ribose deacetylase (regulator of RNase III)
MIEQQIDLWEVEADVRCITTNGTVTYKGENIMGGGCAREAAERYPNLPRVYGHMIEQYGNHVYLMPTKIPLVMFPTKPQIWESASLELVLGSCAELLALSVLYGWERVALPRPGCGLGGLDWNEVGPIVADILHEDRFIIIDYPEAANGDTRYP